MKLLALFFLSQITSAKVYKIGTYLIPKYVQSAEQGEFIALTKEIAQKNNIKIQIEVYPPARTVKKFLAGELDGYFPSLDVLNSTQVAKSVPFYFKKDFLFYLAKEPIAKIEDQDICLTNGYPYAPEINNSVNTRFYFANSDEDCLSMLQKRRVQGFICEAVTGVGALEKLKIKSIKVKQKYLSTQDVYYAFRYDKEGKTLANKFSSVIKLKREDLSLKKLFKSASQKVSNYIKEYDPTVN